MLKPQVLNIITVCVFIVPLVYFLPDLNGSAGAIAASIGELAGLLAVYHVVRRVTQRKILKQECRKISKGIVFGKVKLYN